MHRLPKLGCVSKSRSGPLCWAPSWLRISFEQNQCLVLSHPVPAWRGNELVAIDIPFSRCAACEQTWSSSSCPTLRPYSRSWYEAWGVKCGFCGRPFHLGVSSSPPNSDTVLVTDRLWRDAVDGSELFERYLLGRPCGWLPPTFDLGPVASIPVRRRRRCQMAFELIVPEASAPAFGMRRATCVTTCRTINPFRRVAMMAAVQWLRFNDLIGTLFVG